MLKRVYKNNPLPKPAEPTAVLGRELFPSSLKKLRPWRKEFKILSSRPPLAGERRVQAEETILLPENRNGKIKSAARGRQGAPLWQVSAKAV